MDGWMERWLVGWTDGWMVKCMLGLVEVQLGQVKQGEIEQGGTYNVPSYKGGHLPGLPIVGGNRARHRSNTGSSSVSSA